MTPWFQPDISETAANSCQAHGKKPTAPSAGGAGSWLQVRRTIGGIVNGGEKVDHRGGGIVYHRHDEKRLNWEPVRVRSGAGVRRSGVARIMGNLGGNVLPAVLEAVAGAVYLQDVALMGEAVQQCSGQPLRLEDRGPFFEGEDVGDQNVPRP